MAVQPTNGTVGQRARRTSNLKPAQTPTQAGPIHEPTLTIQTPSGGIITLQNGTVADLAWALGHLTGLTPQSQPGGGSAPGQQRQQGQSSGSMSQQTRAKLSAAGKKAWANRKRGATGKAKTAGPGQAAQY